MKKYFLTIFFLMTAIIVFCLRFFVTDEWKEYCDIAAFFLSTVAALVDMYFSVKNSKKTEKRIAELEEKAGNAVYSGETIGYVPDVDTTKLKEELKKKYPEMNA